LEGINAVVVGLMWAATLYLLKDISIMHFNKVSFLNFSVISGTVLALHFSKIPAPIIVIICLLLGFIF
jgi:chromate transporter